MILDIEDHTTEYYSVIVEEPNYEYSPFFRRKFPEWEDLWLDIDKWCEKTFGGQGIWGGPNSAWKRMGPRYFFQHEKDREWFVLRWA